MQRVTLVSMDCRIEPDYTLLLDKQYTILSRHNKVLNLRLVNKTIISLVESSIAQGPRQLRLAQKLPANNEFSFPSHKPQQFCCDLVYSFGSINTQLIDLAWNMLIQQQRLPVDPIQRVTQHYLQRGINTLLAALEQTQSSSILHFAVKNLLGLGHGLTPSGDDFLCGLLIALNLPQSPFYQQRDNLKQAVLANLTLTHPISIGFLHDACLSQVSQPVQLFIQHLYQSQCPRSVIQQVTALGHRSGYDLLSGLLAGLPHLTNKRVHLCPYIVD